MKRRDKKRIIFIISIIIIVLLGTIISLYFLPDIKFTGLQPVQQATQTVGGAEGFASNDSGKNYEYTDLDVGESSEENSMNVVDTPPADNFTGNSDDAVHDSGRDSTYNTKTVYYEDKSANVDKSNKEIILDNPDRYYSCVFDIYQESSDTAIWESEKIPCGGKTTWNAYKELDAGFYFFNLKYTYYEEDNVVGSGTTVLRVEVTK